MVRDDGCIATCCLQAHHARPLRHGRPSLRYSQFRTLGFRVLAVLEVHIVFDDCWVDGSIADTEKFYTVVQEKILADYGKKFDWSLKAKMMGKKALEAGRIFVEDSGLVGLLTPEEFIQRRELMLHAMFPDSDLMPGKLNECT